MLGVERFPPFGASIDLAATLPGGSTASRPTKELTYFGWAVERRWPVLYALDDDWGRAEARPSEF